MVIFKLLLIWSFFQCSIALAVPEGYEGAVLGNSSARPGDIGAAVSFPSLLAFQKNTETRIYSGISVIQDDFDGDPTHLNKDKQKFIPHFTATSYIFRDFFIANYVAYRGVTDKHEEIRNVENYQFASADVSTEEIEFGIAAAKKLNEKWSFGLDLSAIRSKEFNSAKIAFNSGGNNRLISYEEEKVSYDLIVSLSASYQHRNHFYTLGLSSPNYQFDSNGESRYLEQRGNQVAIVRTEDLNPTIETPSRINIGWSFEIGNYTFTTELHHYFDYIKEKQSEDSVFQDENLTIDNETEFRGGVKVARESTDLYFGTLISSGARSQDQSYQEAQKYLFSTGIKLKNQTSKPLFGMFYLVDRYEESELKSIGFNYSTEYSF